MHDPIDRQIRELTEDRSGFVDDLRQLEMAAWVDDDELRDERSEHEDGDD